MATLQKFKLLATQCATAVGSPSRSPLPATAAKSPSFHLRRRKTTLRRLLSRSSSSSFSSSTRRFLRRGESSAAASDRAERKGLLSHTSLKDLFVSSPSQPDPSDAGRRDVGGEAEGSRAGGGNEAGCGGCRSPSAAGGRRFGFEGIGGAALAGRRTGGGFAARFGSTAALRYRLLRRAWRPVLLTIPE
ncbi:hypothetical protein Taro_045392 [Colocasia esculenta]|uniref:Uncharacterized protein n=1 Tax=Colocasia esculenta TaxID=4460 RepID=A0A843WPB9_COLES|nr:hypothetical protein [Colocasia esculenta]